MVRPQGFTGARDHVSAYEISLISVIGINVILAVSLNMISGFCGQISLGHGAFYGVGAYAAALAREVGHRTTLILALAAGAIVGRLARDRRRLCVAARAQRFPRRHDDRASTSCSPGFVRKQKLARRRNGHQRHPGLGPRSRSGNMALIIGFAIVTVALSLYINQSWMGFTFRAVGEDEDAATTLAVNVSSYKLAAFGIGTALAGLAGGLYAYFTQFITVDAFDFIVSVDAAGHGGHRRHRLDLGCCRGGDRPHAAAGGDPRSSTTIGCWYSAVCWCW